MGSIKLKFINVPVRKGPFFAPVNEMIPDTMGEMIIDMMNEMIDAIGETIIATIGETIIDTKGEMIFDATIHIINVIRELKIDSPTEITVASKPPAFANVSIIVFNNSIPPFPTADAPFAARSVIGF